jgi:hypothetical protein
MTAVPTSPIVLHADQEHGRLRAAVLFLLLLAIFLLYFLLRALWLALAPARVADVAFIVACPSAIVLALVAMWGVERGLKRVWHSGRSITLDNTGIHVQDGERPDYTLNWDGHLNDLYWSFVLAGYKRGGRERRLPEKWVCLAAQVQEEENRLVVYTYLAPKEAEQWLKGNGRPAFHPILPQDLYGDDIRTRYFSLPNRPDKIPADLLAGKDGKFWLAEQRRWAEGFELTLPDFETFISIVNSQQ